MCLGSHTFIFMACIMSIEDIERISLLAWRQNIRFFERLGAQAIDARPDMNGACRMSFTSQNLKKPPGLSHENIEAGVKKS